MSIEYVDWDEIVEEINSKPEEELEPAEKIAKDIVYHFITDYDMTTRDMKFIVKKCYELEGLIKDDMEVE